MGFSHSLALQATPNGAPELRRCKRKNRKLRLKKNKEDKLMINDEITLFNESITEWSEKWWWGYCFDENGITSDFKKDMELYFPFFLEHDPKILIHENLVDFSSTTYNHKIENIEKFRENIIKWKYGSQYYEINYKNSLKIKNGNSIDCVFNHSSLVSRIFWKHIYNPLSYPIFDQRTLRTFALLFNKSNEFIPLNHLWIGGVPTGTNIEKYYDSCFKKIIINSIKEITNDIEKFLLLRKIDYALFAFDKFIISKSINKTIPIFKKIVEICDEKIQNFTFSKCNFKTSD
ncbi:MAG: hypothetical protein ABII25_10265 [bacterium]